MWWLGLPLQDVYGTSWHSPPAIVIAIANMRPACTPVVECVPISFEHKAVLGVNMVRTLLFVWNWRNLWSGFQEALQSCSWSTLPRPWFQSPTLQVGINWRQKQGYNYIAVNQISTSKWSILTMFSTLWLFWCGLECCVNVGRTWDDFPFYLFCSEVHKIIK